VGYERLPSAAKLDGPSAAHLFFNDCFIQADPTRETLWVAHVDRSRRCLYLDWFPGLEAQVDVSVREIVAQALEFESAGIVLSHNHPSGDATPSFSDICFTRRLATSLEGLDCKVLDHLIMAGNDCTSFRRNGLL